jgi:hypothetical protein
MVPLIAHIPDPVITHPKSDGRMLINQLSQDIDDLTVIFLPGFIVVGQSVLKLSILFLKLL